MVATKWLSNLKKKSLLLSILLSTILLFLNNQSIAQCGPSTPSFTVDLSGNPDSAWVSSWIVRQDTCCGPSGNCVEFSLTLDSAAKGIIFDVCDGALPSGALFYQVDCGPQTAVGNVLCLSGPGPHNITFCKPGNNSNLYCIKSISEPDGGPDLAVSDGCIDTLTSSGFEDTSIVWTSVFPGARGSYDTSLSCKFDCPTTIVTGGNGYPPYIDFEVCGVPLGGCEASPYCDTVRVNFFSTLNVDILPENPTVCFGQSNTWIRADASGGAPPYNISWSTNETTDSIQVGVGTYYVTLSDNTGCPPTYDTVTVTEFLNPITADAGTDQTVCLQNLPIQLNGLVTAATGGIWSGGNGTFSPTDTSLNATYTPTQTEINSGSIQLYLTTTGNGTCPAATDTINIQFTSFDASLSLNTTNVSCFGGSDGTSTVTVTNGSPPFTYLWDANAGNQNTAIADSLSVGSYTVTVTDNNGCTDTITATITEPQALVASISASSDASCFGGSDGSATATATGGTTPYTYNWPSSGTNAIENNLAQGTYTVTVTDANGCTDTSQVTINEPTQLVASISDSTDVSCFGGSDGSATASATGGTSPYTYSWPSSGTNPIENNLAQGTYTVTVTDANGCTDISMVTINQPNQLVANMSSFTNVSCFGGSDGSATATASGGTSPYTYNWSTNESSSTISNLSQGKYRVTISDANGCFDTVSVQISQPSQLFANINLSTDVSCFEGSDGFAVASANGGTAPYSYLWPSNNSSAAENNLSAGNYTVTVTDANGCTNTATAIINEPNPLSLSAIIRPVSCYNGNDGQVSVSPVGGTRPYTYNWSTNTTDSSTAGLSKGNYGLTITDNNGCRIDSIFNITEPNPITLSASGNDTICAGSNYTISATASGGNGNYTYNWSNGLGSGQSKNISINSTTTYSVEVTDSKGCRGNRDSVTIYVRNLNTDTLKVEKSGDVCRGESTTISATHNGTLGSYTYSWNRGGNGLSSFQVSPQNTQTYILTVVDRCGAVRSDSVTVNVYDYPTINLPQQIAEGCSPVEVLFTDSLNPPGSNFTYLWEFGDGNSSINRTVSYIYRDPGTYRVKLSVTSNHGCKSESSANSGQVIVNPSPTAGFTVSPPEADIENPLINFQNTSSGASQFRWVFDVPAEDSLSNNPSVTYPDTGKYEVSLYIENSYGCTDSITKYVRIKPVFEYDIPNAFTPNPNGPSDGSYNPNALNNDIFFVFAEYVQEFHMMIFNRWGELIFETFDINKGWDGYYKGEICQQDVYVYKVEIKWTDGSVTTKAGDLTLFR